jgi:hypothetical protein
LLSVPQLKFLLERRGLTVLGCIEKEDLVRKLYEHALLARQ